MAQQFSPLWGGSAFLLGVLATLTIIRFPTEISGTTLKCAQLPQLFLILLSSRRLLHKLSIRQTPKIATIKQ
jgi:hypothetical protein